MVVNSPAELEKRIADAISCLNAARERADDRGLNINAAFRELDAGIRGALAILRRNQSSGEPLPATRVRQ